MEGTMRAWHVDQPGPVDTGHPLVARATPVPDPGPGELLLRVLACGVCRTDLHVTEGDLPVHRAGVTPAQCTGKSPSVTCRSVLQTPHASTRSSSSPGPGSGTGVARATSGCPVSTGPGWSTCQARIVVPSMTAPSFASLNADVAHPSLKR